MSNFIKRFANDEKGATAIEYGLIAGLISIGIIAAAGLLGDNISNAFNRVARAVAGTRT